MSLTIAEAADLFIKITLGVSEQLKKSTGIDPLLSRNTYDYGEAPEGWDYKRLKKEIDYLKGELESHKCNRSLYISRLLQSIETMVREGLGEEFSYKEKVASCLGITIEPISSEEIEKLSETLTDRLRERGYTGELKEAIIQWKKDNTVEDTEELQKIADSLLSRAAELTHEKVLPVPEELDIEISFPKNFPYNGYSESKRNYVSRIMLNGDTGWQRAALKHLVTHEALPGHTLYYATKERLFREGKLPIEGTVYLANTPVSPLGEGLCETGQKMLGMVEDEDDVIYDLYNRLSSAMITNIAINYHEGIILKDAAIEEIQKKAYTDEYYAEKRFDFFSHPLWHISFMHYWFGRKIVEENFQKMQDYLPEFYHMAYEKTQTIEGLQKDVEDFLCRRETDIK